MRLSNACQAVDASSKYLNWVGGEIGDLRDEYQEYYYSVSTWFSGAMFTLLREHAFGPTAFADSITWPCCAWPWIKGEDLIVNANMNRIEMLGAVRATESCISCHDVKRGELLGAFSYELLRTPLYSPAEDKEMPVDDPNLGPAQSLN